MKQTVCTTHPKEATLHCFSSIYKANKIKLYDNGRIANGDKAYRSVMGTHGAQEGIFYYEVTVLNASSECLNIPYHAIPPNAAILEPLLASTESLLYDSYDPTILNKGHTRIGWATIKMDIDLPVGADLNGYSIRDVDGSAVHDGVRINYAESYGMKYVGPNDVIGCLVKLMPARPKIKGSQDIYRTNNDLVISQGSEIHFFKNGVHSGIAFSDIYEGTYFPTVGLYQYARVEINLTGPFFNSEIVAQFNARPLCENSTS